jgi:hypothetical protein
MDTVWEYLIATFGGSAIILVVLGIGAATLGRRFLDTLFKQYENRLEEKRIAYEQQLQHQYDEAIERLKSQLAIAAKENEVRFSKLHEQRVEVIAEVYQRLEEARQSAQLFRWTVSSSGVKSEHQAKYAHEVTSKIDEFTKLFGKHQLYFSKALADKLKHLADALYTPALEYKFAITEGSPADAAKQVTVLLDDDSSIDVLLDEIADEFRTLLGSIADVER